MIDTLIQFILTLCFLTIYMYLSAMETLICLREIEFDRAYFLRFCTKYDICFSKYRIKLIVALSSTNTTKIVKMVIYRTSGSVSTNHL